MRAASRTIIALLVAVISTVAGSRPGLSATSAPRIIFTQHDNVWSMTPQGTDITAITTRGTGPNNLPGTSIYYPWYTWSPDGRYLLLVRMTDTGSKTSSEMLLMGADGTLIRSLGTFPLEPSTMPAWAIDGDVIAYSAWSKAATPRSKGSYWAINTVDLQGRKAFLFGHYSLGGCGGGTGVPAASLLWNETGFGEIAPTFEWSLRRKIAVFSGECGAGLRIVDTRTRRVQPLGPHAGRDWDEAALTPAGRLAVTVRARSIDESRNQIALVDLATRRAIRIVGPGELPLWSADGATLYFVRRTRGLVLHVRDDAGEPIDSPTYTSAIWKANADGTHPQRLLSQDAYGFGRLSLVRGGRDIVFSRVANDWRFRSASGKPFHRPSYSALYNQGVSIERFTPGNGAVTLRRGAGTPAAQP